MRNVVPLRPGMLPDPIKLPGNIEAEQAILGSALVNNAVLDRCPWLAPADFFEPVHGRIWQAMLTEHAHDRRADPVTLLRLFQSDPALAELDGAQYLARMAGAAETIGQAAAYAQHVKKLARLRELHAIGAELVECATADDADDAAVIWSGFAARLDRALLDESRPVAKSAAEVCREILAGLETPPQRWSTGIAALDVSLGGGVQEGYVLGFEARPKSFKAQPVTEPVLMQNGTWKTIGELGIGDQLASPDGAPSRVVGVYPQGTRPVFRLTLSDGRSVTADAEHLWSVATKDFANGRTIEKVVTTDDLGEMLKRTRAVWLPRVSGHFGSGDLEVEPYLLGVLIGDGSLTKEGSVRFTSADPELVALVDLALPAGMQARHHGSLEYGVCVAPAQRRQYVNSVLVGLRELGLMGKRAEEKFIPPAYFSASRADRLSLLQGLVDTDAQVSVGYANFTTTSPQLAADIQRLAWSLGMVARAAKPMPTRYSYRGEIRAGRTVYRVNIRADRPHELCRLASKRAALTASRINGVRLRVISVEPAGEAECVCIKVTHPSSLYVTRDYILTHNTGCAHSLLLTLARQAVPSAYFALEMGSGRLAKRMLGHIGGFNSAMFKHVDDRTITRTVEATRALGALPLWFVDCPGMKFARLRAAAAQLATAYGVRAFVLDYWQLVNPDQPTRNKADFLADVAQWCADHAHEHGTTWLICSQENRTGESYGSDGLVKACDWHAVLHKHEQKLHLGETQVETLWMDVKFARDGNGDSIGDEKNPVLYIDPRGPHLAELP